MDDHYYTTTNKSSKYSEKFLSVADTSYLFVDIIRNGTGITSYRNASLEITLTPVEMKKLSFDVIDGAFLAYYNETVSALEPIDTTPLWNITGYVYPGGGEDLLVPALIVGGVVVVAVGVVGGGAMYRKRKSQF